MNPRHFAVIQLTNTNVVLYARFGPFHQVATLATPNVEYTQTRAPRDG